MDRTFSFIIPALNEENLIAGCIKSIKRQKKVVDEIIVVDNGCVDSTVAIARELDCKVVKEGERGIANAKNRGAQIANGDVLCFIDADGVVSPNWLKEARDVLQDPKTDAVVGINFFLTRISRKRFGITLILFLLIQDLSYQAYY